MGAVGSDRCQDGEQPGEVGSVIQASHSSGPSSVPLPLEWWVGSEGGHLRDRASCLLESPKHTLTFLPSGPLDLAPISGKQKLWEDRGGRGKVPKWTPRFAHSTLPAPNGSLSAPSWAPLSCGPPYS